MGLFTKGPQQQKEPQFYMSATNIKTLNYRVYHMGLAEKTLCFLIGFLVGAVVGYLFYGGIGQDEFGTPTALTLALDTIISGACGLFAGTKLIPLRVNLTIKKRKRKLNQQFRDMLEALNTSLGAGKNVPDSFKAAYDDLKVQYEEDAYILGELQILLSGMANNVEVEELLEDLAMRSGIDDISSFANVFKTCYRKGGNIKDTIRSTHEILTDKMEITEEIETIVTASKTEQNIMIVMPIALIGMIKMMSPELAGNYTTPIGIVSTTIGIGLFLLARAVGKSVLEIKI